ncbi:Transposon En/Spm-like [Arabidopsis thaliana x Arabidopsis arenosa]|uniref:Transposon En/Spm-like n=1 Tax=Arabidopsis thaliana x Arabidopsis arenosa TaxID=1240361 RepID=A0A8T1Y9G1_9BRAS|nr:Transposon En/Spm-like [Arabidopsis thaliana x Arabidopsis arenosa]
MSCGGEHEIYTLRRWMYNHRDPTTGDVTKEFTDGLRDFMYQATNESFARENGSIFCPCQSDQFGYGYNQENRFHDMVTDAFHETTAAFAENIIEEPNVDAQRFYDMLDAANQPIYEGCREGQSKLSLASRMMTIKADNNLSENCMDSWAELFKEYLPPDNISAESYYEIQKLVSSLGLPSQMIDVCIDYCMIFWRDDENLQECRFCGKPRYQPTGGRTRVPYKRMWYLPITDRLKRLYQSGRTAAKMRWHAEHSTTNGEITHPSDAKAWKHFQTLYSDFANECRNVYLGLCTDGFSPFGMSGRQYSLWPVILTPYNLPPDMCMQSEFLFLSILVPGPKHLKRALDVFLQPLIHELKNLWSEGVQTFDYSNKQNFNMRAVLMWTISDFPAYGMLSGWTTHGRLSCPYCMDRTDAFQLKHGRKPCWFDCHRRFLSLHHPYRKNKKWFRKNKVVRLPPPVYLSRNDLFEQIDYYGAQETCKRGGNWHTSAIMPDGYGSTHNWHKQSIFWQLPYWKDLLLRHNLDVMHIEKNFFDNFMNTLLNVQGKTKDSMKSRLDLAEICNRPELHITRDGKLPVPNFRLTSEAKKTLFEWVTSEVKFLDGYVSKFSRCVEQGQKFSGMKSHDCHVFMQRLLPFVLLELLPAHVHEAIAAEHQPSTSQADPVTTTETSPVTGDNTGNGTAAATVSSLSKSF